MKRQLQKIQLGSTKIKHLLPVIFLLILSSMASQALGNNLNGGTGEKVSPIKRAAPVYPKYAIKKGIEGAVLLNFSIEKDGGVSDIQVVESDHDGLFDASAILGLQKWVYTKPAQKVRNNYIAIEFALTDDPAATQYSNVEKIQIKED